MNVLIACEESQRVCTAFRERGHNAFSCDIQEPSGGHPEWHILGDALEALKGGTVTTMDGVSHEVGRWDLLIAHPPCTYLTNAGAVRMRKNGEIVPERYAKAMEARSFFLAFYNADVPRVAVENPTPMKIVGLPPYSQAIQPYEYGHPYSKRTCLWLKGLPKLQPTNILDYHEPYVNGGGKRRRGNMRLIDADLYRAALEKTLGEMEKAGDSQTDIADGVRRALRLLDMQPDDDVAPVVHGEWIATTKHKWKTKDNGEVDEFAWDREFHNGPVCTICGFTPCVHCRPDWEDDEGCKEHYVCSVCGAHEEKKYPYCHCGAKMDDSLSRTADNVVQKGETKTMDFYNMIRALDEKSRKIGLTKKERLEKLIYEGLYAMQGAVVIGLNGGYGMLADYLMSEGVIVPPSIKRGGQ